jgi:hypothetical protein
MEDNRDKNGTWPARIGPNQLADFSISNPLQGGFPACAARFVSGRDFPRQKPGLAVASLCAWTLDRLSQITFGLG